MMDALTSLPVLIITLAAIATYASRGLGAMLSGRISPDSAIVDWITCVTYALMAGMVVRMLALPIGALTTTPDWMRLVSTAVGLAAFFITRRNVGVGVVAGSLTLAALTWQAGFA